MVRLSFLVFLHLYGRVVLLPRTTAIQLPVGFPPRPSLIRVAPHALRGEYDRSGDETVVGPDKAGFEQSARSVASRVRLSRSSGISETAPELRGCPSVFGCSRSGEGGWGPFGGVCSLAVGARVRIQRDQPGMCLMQAEAGVVGEEKKKRKKKAKRSARRERKKRVLGDSWPMDRASDCAPREICPERTVSLEPAGFASRDFRAPLAGRNGVLAGRSEQGAGGRHSRSKG
jgi:hypothetical protein